MTKPTGLMPTTIIADAFPLDSSYENMTANVTAPRLFDPRRRAIGVTLAVSGNIMISLALSVQKYAHNR